MKNVHDVKWGFLAVSVLIALISFSWQVEAQQSVSSSISVVAYAAKGAAAGAAVGAIAGDTGKGAEVNAVAGTVAGGREARKNKKDKEQAAEEAKASTLEQFNKGFGGCMEGRGYTIK
jgi:hypothetical protein